MFSMVLMAALTTGTDMPDFGRRGGRGGCCGCYGGMGWGGGWGGCMGMGYGGYRMGYGGCMGMGMGMGWGGGWGGCMGMGYGGYGMGYGGYGRRVWGGGMPVMGGAYVSSPLISSPMIGSVPMVASLGSTPMGLNGALLTPGTTQSFYPSTVQGNQANEATITVHLPADAILTIDGQPTQSRSDTRTFRSPPLDPGKTYTYTLTAQINRDGRFVKQDKVVEVQAGQSTKVTISFDNLDRKGNRGDTSAAPAEENGVPVRQTPTRRTPPVNPTPPARSFPTPPPDRQ